MENIEIRTETITLAQLLKLANRVESGGEAKVLIQEGQVRVNGQVETRRGRQLVPGDQVEIEGDVPLLVTRE